MTSATAKRTFRVSDVEINTKPLPEAPYHEAVASFLANRRIQACSADRGPLVAGVRGHPLIAALHHAFAEHRPVCLSPDMVWLTLLQGVAHHVNMNAEKLRKKLVRHEGKPTIVVIRDDFVMGSPHNAWPEVFSELSRAIHDHVGSWYEVAVADFSTTDATARATSAAGSSTSSPTSMTARARARGGWPSSAAATKL